MTTAALVPAAGRGQRFGSPENKIWAKIGGHPILWWSVSALNNHEAIDSIFVIAASAEIAAVRSALQGLSKVAGVVEGGATRAESVLNGLQAADSELIAVHDAARPLLCGSLISRVLDAARSTGAAIPGLPIRDTIKRVGVDGSAIETVSREDLWTVQTPQCAFRAHLLDAYRQLGDRALAMSDEGGVLQAAGRTVKVVPGDPENIKITLPEDHKAAERILRIRDAAGAPDSGRVRTGFGYDVHPFQEARPLWLGGVRIPHPRGLAGHSDADVLLHAVCDALLGAAGLGDIGQLFPDTDQRHKDRPSIEFLREVGDKIGSLGWRISNIDVALLAEEPRIGPFRDQICAVIADGLRTAPKQINIKATTSEGMGFAGRREGIACWAVATLVS